ncbi:hypothetical protein [Fodinibius saliphilus]|uniref:hypothetical protein n=1 Tax=Fodinibius saliphilus TaxID=1920650 RepID=UPI001107B527|nr:hypothetical protein [Fodinibius saliphilus]
MKDSKFLIQFLSTSILILAFILVGCDSVIDSQISDSKDSNSKSASNLIEASSHQGPPTASGPRVIRFEGTATFLITDPKNDYAYFVGANVVDICQGIPSFSAVNFMEVQPAEDLNRIIRNIKGKDVLASLWNPAPSSCADVLAGEPLATGIANFTSTDNDLLVFLNPDNKNANSFGISSSGKFELTSDGKSVRANAHSRCVWDGVDPTTLKCKDKVNVAGY